METPYVVMLQSIKILSGDGGGLSGKCGQQIQECWEFEHPRRDALLNEQGVWTPGYERPYLLSHAHTRTT